MVGDPRGRRACYCDLGNIASSECGGDHSCDATGQDAMSARVFGVHRRLGEGLPGRLAIRRRISVGIAVANGGDGSPEIIMVFGIQHRDQCVVERNSPERHESRALADIHLLSDCELS